jgi:hypothetical protein
MRLPIVLLVVVILGSCSSAPPVSLIPDSFDSQPPEVVFFDGEAGIRCGEYGGCVAIQGEDELTLWVTVTNTGGSDFVFDPTQVSLTQKYWGGQRKVLAFSKTGWLEVIQGEADSSRFWAVIAGALSGAGAAMSGQQTTTYSGSYNGSSGSGYYSGSATTYNPYAVQQTQAQNQQMMRDINKKHSSRKSYWSAAYLGKTTVLPGQIISGAVKIGAKAQDIYDIQVPFSDGLHSLAFTFPEAR